MQQVQNITKTKFKPVFNRILARLRKAGYKVHNSILGTADNGVPHMRQRLYIVALHGKLARPVSFPKKLKEYRWSLLNILKKRKAKETDKKDLKPLNKDNINRAKKSAIAKGVDVQRTPVVVDMDSSDGWSSFQVEKSPCLTRTRCAGLGYYVLSSKRRLFHEDMIRLQGMNPKRLDILDMSDTDIRRAAGNAMSANVVARILSCGLYCAGLIDHRYADPYKKK